MLCVWVFCVTPLMQYLCWPEEGVSYTGTGVTDGVSCKVGARNQTQDYCKKNTVTKSNLKEESVYFIVNLPTTGHQWKKPKKELKQGRNWKGGAEAQTVEECSLLAFSQAQTQLFLKPPRTTWPRAAPPIVGWAVPHQL